MDLVWDLEQTPHLAIVLGQLLSFTGTVDQEVKVDTGCGAIWRVEIWI